ncbi:MAG: M4 family metallopeptidase, partial [Planctomycetota bacterium]
MMTPRLVGLLAGLGFLGAVAGSGLAAAPLVKQRSDTTGFATFVTGTGGAIIDTAIPPGNTGVTPMAFLVQHGGLFGITESAGQLRRQKTHTDALNHTHTTFQQVHQGVEVFSGVIKIHQDVTGQVYAANGDFHPIPAKINVAPTLDGKQAADVARRAIERSAAETESQALVIVDPGWYGDPHVGARLAWHVIIRDLSVPMRDAFFIDAHSGAVLDQWSVMYTARFREVYDGMQETALPGTLVRAEGDPPVGLPEDADRAYDYAGDTYDYFERAFGRDSIDGMGMAMILTVDSQAMSCPNARWNGSQSLYCTGAVTDDITSHEITHGVTQFTANLIYQNQSGQLNESYSDIFGEMVDLFNGDVAFVGPPSGPAWPAHGTGPGADTPNNARSVCSGAPDYVDGYRWLVGEDAEAFGGSIRDMWDPPCDGDPDRAHSTLQTCPGGDNGGVHSGSGIPNHAFAMLTDG